jgi:hypothetical protein
MLTPAEQMLLAIATVCAAMLCSPNHAPVPAPSFDLGNYMSRLSDALACTEGHDAAACRAPDIALP